LGKKSGASRLTDVHPELEFDRTSLNKFAEGAAIIFVRRPLFFRLTNKICEALTGAGTLSTRGI